MTVIRRLFQKRHGSGRIPERRVVQETQSPGIDEIGIPVPAEHADRRIAAPDLRKRIAIIGVGGEGVRRQPFHFRLGFQ